jgi:hypothetical protein
MTRPLLIKQHTRRAPADPFAAIRAATTMKLALEMQDEQERIEGCMWELGNICARNIRAEMAREEV